MKKVKNGKKRGSALIIVLGMLAVLMLMAIAFAINMRTERGGSTNLRHTVTSRQLLDVAIDRIMNELNSELTTNCVVKDYDGPNSATRAIVPMAPWHIKASRGTTSHVKAGILFSDVVDYLYGSRGSAEGNKNLRDQLLGVRAAKPEWLPIYGGIKTVNTDSIAGRYAYIIVNNSGRMDVNSPDAYSFLNSCGVNYIAPTEDNPYRSTRQFFRRNKGNAALPTAEGTPYGATSHAMESFGPSTNDYKNGGVEYGIRPPKFPITREKLQNITEETAYELIDAFDAAFVDNFVADPYCGGTAGATGYSRFAPLNNAKLSAPYGDIGIRYAHMAALALCDYVDEDSIPNNNGEIFKAVKNDSGLSNLSPLDLPCTEPVPMIHGCSVYISRHDDVPPDLIGCLTEITDTDGNVTGFKARVDYPVRVTVSSLWLDRNRASLEGSDYVVFANITTANGENIKTPPSVLDANDLYPNLTATWVADPNGQSSAYEHPNTSALRSTDLANEPDLHGIVRLEAEFPADLTEEYLEEVFADVFVRLKFKFSVVDNLGTGNKIQQVPGPMYPEFVLDFEILRSKLVQWSQGPQHEVYTLGWAYVSDPRFACDTWSVNPSAKGDNQIWATSFRALLGEAAGEEWGATLLDCMPIGAYSMHHPTESMYPLLYMKFLLKECVADGESFANELFGLSGANLDPPDSVWSSAWGDANNLQECARTYTRNGYPESVGELGNLPLAPLRTISLFDGRNWLRNGARVPCHRVLDGFSLSVEEGNSEDPKQEYKTGELSEYCVNLNPGYTRDPIATNNFIDCVSFYPLASAIREVIATSFPAYSPGASLDLSISMASNFYENVASDYTYKVRGGGNPDNDWRWATMFDGISFIGSTKDGKTIIDDIDELDPLGSKSSDYRREKFISDLAPKLTTRQEVFTVIVQADTFSPQFGRKNSVEGSALSSAKAVFEVWRDPEVPRNVNGVPMCVHGNNVKDCTSSDCGVKANAWHMRFLHYY